MKRLFTAIFTLLGTFAAMADSPRITSRVEPDSIFIGDRFDLIIEVDKDLVQSVAFPEFTPDPAGGIEMVESAAPDTLERDGRRIKIRKRYTLAAFEEGMFNLGKAGVLYADKNITDTLYAPDDNILRVATFVIDSTATSIYDLKPQKTLRFRFGEISGWLGLGILVAALLAAAAYLLNRWLQKRGRSIKRIFTPAPPVPPHIAAIKALEELHNRKLWQNSNYKGYYSGLSDILRTYISGRYGIGAMEMTTDEILAAVRDTDMGEKCIADLAAVLRDADLVKFAKSEPEAAQNEDDYHRAYYFVEETKQVEPDETGGDESKILKNKLLTAVLLLAATFSLSLADDACAQRMPERSLVRKGNRQYGRGNFERSIERYTQALQHDSLSFEARYDLGNALFRAERFEGAEKALAAAAADTTRTDADRADAFFNLGDVQFRQQNLQGALESFKNALRLNPSDMEAKYNYAFTKKLLDEQQQQQQQQQNQNNQNDQNNQQQQNKDNQQDNQNDKNDDNQNNQNQNDDNNERNQDRNDDSQQKNDDREGKNGERPRSSISPEQAEAMLEAIQAQEDKTQDKVKEKQGVIIRGKKNW